MVVARDTRVGECSPVPPQSCAAALARDIPAPGRPGIRRVPSLGYTRAAEGARRRGRPPTRRGGRARLIAPVLKTGRVQTLAGSNPAPSACFAGVSFRFASEPTPATLRVGPHRAVSCRRVRHHWLMFGYLNVLADVPNFSSEHLPFTAPAQRELPPPTACQNGHLESGNTCNGSPASSSWSRMIGQDLPLGPAKAGMIGRLARVLRPFPAQRPGPHAAQSRRRLSCRKPSVLMPMAMSTAWERITPPSRTFS